ncbi:MAG: phosphoribosylglycinamide synthetase C domain-containing protein, partial [Candidatus Omnitrophota bacterium]
QDHKRVYDFDEGANTGGMGAYSPAPVVTEQLYNDIINKIVLRTISGLAKEGIDFRGVLYTGIMITSDGPQVLEFNARFGDPETQAILPRLNSDLVEAMLAVIDGRLGELKARGGLDWDSRACVCVVCASGGYPGKYEKGKEISGLEEAEAMPDTVVFHAGTIKSPGHRVTGSPVKYLTSGGRVLGVTGLGSDIKAAIAQAYKGVEKIHFQGMHYRKDIGGKALL